MRRVGGMFACLASVAVGLKLLGPKMATARTNQAPWRMTSYFCLGSIIMPRGLRGRSPRPIHYYCSGFVPRLARTSARRRRRHGPAASRAGNVCRQRGPTLRRRKPWRSPTTRRLAILDSFGICVLEVCYSQIIWNKDQPLHDYHHRAADHSDETPEEKDADAGSSRKRKWETWNRLIIPCLFCANI